MTKYMVDFQQWLFIYWIQPLNEPLFCFNIFFRLFVWQNRKQNKSDVLLGERPVWAAQPAISPWFSSGIAMLEYCRVKTLETFGPIFFGIFVFSWWVRVSTADDAIQHCVSSWIARNTSLYEWLQAGGCQKSIQWGTIANNFDAPILLPYPPDPSGNLR